MKVLDFGIVKAADGIGGADAIETHAHDASGHAGVHRARAGAGSAAIDSRADIYAIGCVAYWLLTGQLVFTADTPIGGAAAPRPDSANAASARTELPVPSQFDELILSCLAKDPAKRPQSAKELARRLTAIPGIQPWTEERAHDWWVRHEPAAQFDDPPRGISASGFSAGPEITSPSVVKREP